MAAQSGREHKGEWEFLTNCIDDDEWRCTLRFVWVRGWILGFPGANVLGNYLLQICISSITSFGSLSNVKKNFAQNACIHRKLLLSRLLFLVTKRVTADYKR